MQNLYLISLLHLRECTLKKGKLLRFCLPCTGFQEKLRERERELRKRKEREEQETERERLKVRRKEAVATFQALLVETIKDPQVLPLVTWFYVLGTLS